MSVVWLCQTETERGEGEEGGVKKETEGERSDLPHELISSRVAPVFISHQETRVNHKELLSFTSPNPIIACKEREADEARELSRSSRAAVFWYHRQEYTDRHNSFQSQM